MATHLPAVLVIGRQFFSALLGTFLPLKCVLDENHFTAFEKIQGTQGVLSKVSHLLITNTRFINSATLALALALDVAEVGPINLVPKENSSLRCDRTFHGLTTLTLDDLY